MGVEPIVHCAKIRVRLGLSWQVCIKYVQTMVATKQIQVRDECQTVVLLMGKMQQWSVWHLCNWTVSSQAAGLHQSTAAEHWAYNARTEVLIFFWRGAAGGNCISPLVSTNPMRHKECFCRSRLSQVQVPNRLSKSTNNHIRVCWSCNIVNKTTKLKNKTKTKAEWHKTKTTSLKTQDQNQDLTSLPPKGGSESDFYK